MDLVPDERVALPVAQGVILWSMRVWVMGLHHDIAASSRIKDVMERLGADEAAPYFEAFMFSVGGGAKRRIDIHCTCHPQVGVDERLLLDILALAQESRSLEVVLLLRGMVTNQTAPAVLRSAQGLGTELALAGRYLLASEVGESSSELDCNLAQETKRCANYFALIASPRPASSSSATI